MPSNGRPLEEEEEGGGGGENIVTIIITARVVRILKIFVFTEIKMSNCTVLSLYVVSCSLQNNPKSIS
jgi:hypothetical protein